MKSAGIATLMSEYELSKSNPSSVPDPLGAQGVLYVVATPIGHLGDLSRRAEEVLKAVQIVAAEDTRRTGVLLDHIGHRAPELLSLHEHNEAKVAPRLVERLCEGASVALVSDAGTPLVSDPGFILLRAAHAAGIPVVPIPGPSCVTALLSVCPLPCHPFRFVGFLPAKAKHRQARLRDFMSTGDAIVFLEAPHRIVATLNDIAPYDRCVMLGRELTKQYETLLLGDVESVKAALGSAPRGEIVGVIECAEAPARDRDAREVLTVLLKELSPAQASRLAAGICQQSKSAMYELALQLKTD